MSWVLDFVLAVAVWALGWLAAPDDDFAFWMVAGVPVMCGLAVLFHGLG